MNCPHYYFYPATWGSSGGSPAEDGCNHPKGSGDCNDDDCPLDWETAEYYKSNCSNGKCGKCPACSYRGDQEYDRKRDEGLI